MNYFSILCFFWAVVGLVSRIFIIKLGEKWNKWELDKAYTEEKPKWIYFLGVFGVGLVLLTWYQVITTDISFNFNGIVTLLDITFYNPETADSS